MMSNQDINPALSRNDNISGSQNEISSYEYSEDDYKTSSDPYTSSQDDSDYTEDENFTSCKNDISEVHNSSSEGFLDSDTDSESPYHDSSREYSDSSSDSQHRCSQYFRKNFQISRCKKPEVTLRSSVLESDNYAKQCLQLEADLYKIFQIFTSNSDKQHHMACFLQSKFDMIWEKGHTDQAFAVLIYGYDILSHYGAWDIGKMGKWLKIALEKLSQGDTANSLYFEAAICQELCYQVMLKNKRGQAHKYIQRALQCIQFLEPCEWTSWVYQMKGMLCWTQAEISRHRSNDLFAATAKAFELLREHILRSYTKTGIHAKYCAIWGLLRAAKAKLKLPWHYQISVLMSFLKENRVSDDDIKEVSQLLQKAEKEMKSLSHLPIYFENMSAEMLELKMFSSVRKSQLQSEGGSEHRLSWIKLALQQHKELTSGWTFPQEHAEGLDKVQQYLLAQQNTLLLKIHKNKPMNGSYREAYLACKSLGKMKYLSESPSEIT